MSDKADEDKERREFFITTPLRAAHSLRSSLQIDELSHSSIVGFSQPNPRDYFIYSCLDEVTKFATACIRWNEFLTGDENNLEKSDHEAAKVVYRATIESVADEQQMWARKLTEMLSQLILFTDTNEQYFYRLYLLGVFLDQYQRLQRDFDEFYGCKNENAQHSIDDAISQIEKLCDQHKIENFWFYSIQDVRTKKKIRVESAKNLFRKALKLASNEQKLVLGVSYETGYSSPSRSIHINVGGVSNPVTSNTIEQELMRMSLASMHVVSVAHRLVGVEPTGEALLFEKSISGEKGGKDFFKSISDPAIEIGDLVFAHGDSICLVEDKCFSDYGYCSFKVKYLTKPLLPEVITEWLPSRGVRLAIAKKTLIKNLKAIFSGVEDASKKIDSFSDKEYFSYIAKTVGDMEKLGDLKSLLKSQQHEEGESTQ